ncbi:MAG TPA: hypothetical protein VHR41_05860 [Gemmatimonadales bacterium]|nr:hypothetical protein [Gemmatimonadales bacterium]
MEGLIRYHRQHRVPEGVESDGHAGMSQHAQASGVELRDRGTGQHLQKSPAGGIDLALRGQLGRRAPAQMQSSARTLEAFGRDLPFEELPPVRAESV